MHTPCLCYTKLRQLSLSALLVLTSHLCPLFAALWRTYNIFCSNFFFIYTNKFVLSVLRCGWLTTYFIQLVFLSYKQICPFYHHCMGKKLSISRCNRHFSLLQLLGARSSLMSAVSTTPSILKNKVILDGDTVSKVLLWLLVFIKIFIKKWYMYIFMKVLFKTNLFIWLSHF